MYYLSIREIFKCFLKIYPAVLDPLFKTYLIGYIPEYINSREARYGIRYGMKDYITVTVFRELPVEGDINASESDGIIFVCAFFKAVGILT